MKEEIVDEGEGAAEVEEESERPAPRARVDSPRIGKRLDEMAEAVAEHRSAIARLEAQMASVTDFVRALCRANGIRVPDAFRPETDEGKAKAATKPKAN